MERRTDIRENAQSYDKAVQNGTLEGIAKDAQSKVEDYQPYKKAENKTLSLLSELDNFDKHRLLIYVPRHHG